MSAERRKPPCYPILNRDRSTLCVNARRRHRPKRGRPLLASDLEMADEEWRTIEKIRSRPRRLERTSRVGDHHAGTEMVPSRRVHGEVQLRLSLPLHLYQPAGGSDVRHCTAVMVFRIDESHFGETQLNGLKFALVIRSGRVMAEGNWVFAGVVDDSANDPQRTALATIVGDEAGGAPALIRQNLVSDFRGVEHTSRSRFTSRGSSARPRSPISLPSRSRASPRATAAASRSTSTIPRTRRLGGVSPN
jgi:hypothetical protein